MPSYERHVRKTRKRKQQQIFEISLCLDKSTKDWGCMRGKRGKPLGLRGRHGSVPDSFAARRGNVLFTTKRSRGNTCKNAIKFSANKDWIFLVC